MRLKLLAVVSLIVFAILLSRASMSMSTGMPAPSYGFDLSIVPDQQVSDAYQAKLSIRELASNKIVAAPTARFRAGEPANITTGAGTDGMNFQFSVAVNKSGAAAEYDAAVLHANTIVSRSQGKISLRN